jgi:septum formation protein
MLEIPYGCAAVLTDESLDSPLAEDPPALATALASEKARAARAAGAMGTVLAFDTIVVHGGRLLGKPLDLDDARRMLHELSGSVHEVVTGVAVLGPDSSTAHVFAVTTPVRMRTLTAEQVEVWVARGELLGCAGAYNIESHLAEVDLDQCFQNVAGLPLCHLYLALSRMQEALGIGQPSMPVAPCDDARGVKCALGPALMATLD